jgi:WD40 repeat protein
MTAPASDRDPVERLAEEFAERYRRGERPALSEYTAKYPELAQQIRDLFPVLAVMEELGSAPGPPGGPVGTPDAGRGPIPGRLGEYLLLREVGRGGMGLVYEAVQESLGRHVALKVLPSRALAGPTHRERFRREAQIAARLHHTNIVPVFGVGEHQGVCYYAMQFIQGQGLDAVLRELQGLRGGRSVPADTGPDSAAGIARGLRTGPLTGPRPRDGESAPPACPPAPAEPLTAFSPHQPPPGSRGAACLTPSHSELTGPSELPYFLSVARVGVQVAEALEYAHRQGVLHRDIKPSNLLLDTAGAVWVTDFGLAKAEGADELTNTGDFVGTLRYMAPERFAGRCDPRSDVYGLGVTLYELATLAPAFSDSDRVRLIERVTRDEPPRPRQVDGRVPRDLETVVLKAMAKDPAARYATAGALAEDLRRFLAGRPVRARRVGLAERAWRWGKRNPALAAASVLAAAGLAAALAVTVWFGLYQYRAAAESRRERQQTANALAESQRHLAELALDKGLTLCEQGEVGRGMLWLAHSLELVPPEAGGLGRVIRTNLAGWRGRSGALRECSPYADGPATVGVLSPDGKTVLIRNRNEGTVQFWDRGGVLSPDGKTVLIRNRNEGTVQFWDRAAGNPRGPAHRHPGKLLIWVFSPDSRTCLTASEDNTARLWDTATGQPLGRPLAHQGPVLAAAFSPDSQTVVTGSGDTTARIWRAATGEPVGAPLPHKGPVGYIALGPAEAVAFSPDGRTVLTASQDGTARFWEAATGRPLGEPLAHEAGVNCVAFRPDGQAILTGSQDGSARLWDRATGKPLGPPLLHQAPVKQALFSPDGKALLIRTYYGRVRLWEAATARPVGDLRHISWVESVAFSPDSRIALTGSDDGTVCLWEAATARRLVASLRHPGPVQAMAMSADGRTLLVACLAGVLTWEVNTGNFSRHILRHPSLLNAVAFSPDGRRVLTGGGTVQLWDAATGKPLDPPFPHPGGVEGVAFSPDGKMVVTGGWENGARLWESATGRAAGLLPQDHINGVAFSPDGRTLLTGSEDYTARLWDVATGRPVGPALRHQHGVDAVAFSPDGKKVATGSTDCTVRFWDAATGEPVGPPPLQLPTLVKALAFSPDGRTLLVGTTDGVAQAWEVGTGQRVGPQLHRQGEIRGVAFSPDGRTVLTGSRDHTARLWDAATGFPLGPALEHENDVRAVAFGPDGRAVATASYDTTARLWAVPEPVPGEPERVTAWAQVITGMELGADGSIRPLDPPTWLRRRQRLEELGGAPVP